MRGPLRRSIFEVIVLWCAWMDARGFSPKTVESYWPCVLRAGKIAGTDPRDFTEATVVAVLASYPRQGPARGMMIRALRSFFTWAEDGEMLVNPARRIPVPRPKLGPAPRLSREELEALWASASRIDPRARPTLVLLYYTGARVGSIVEVRPEHIRFDRDGRPSIHFAVTKGDFPYEVPLEHPDAVQAVAELMELRDWKPKMAASRRPTLVGVGSGVVWKWVHDAGQASGVRAFPHLIRHTFASDLAQDPDVDVRTFVELMNHRDASQMRRYAAASEPRMRRAVARLGTA